MAGSADQREPTLAPAGGSPRWRSPKPSTGISSGSERAATAPGKRGGTAPSRSRTRRHPGGVANWSHRTPDHRQIHRGAPRRSGSPQCCELALNNDPCPTWANRVAGVPIGADWDPTPMRIRTTNMSGLRLAATGSRFGAYSQAISRVIAAGTSARAKGRQLAADGAGQAGSPSCGCTDRSNPGSTRPGGRARSRWFNEASSSSELGTGQSRHQRRLTRRASREPPREPHGGEIAFACHGGALGAEGPLPGANSGRGHLVRCASAEMGMFTVRNTLPPLVRFCTSNS